MAVGCCILLAFGAGGAEGSGGLLIWPLFGTANQLLSGLALLVIKVMLVRLKRPMWITLILLVMTLAALVIQLSEFSQKGNWFLLGLDVVVLVAAIQVTLECASALRKPARDSIGGEC